MTGSCALLLKEKHKSQPLVKFRPLLSKILETLSHSSLNVPRRINLLSDVFYDIAAQILSRQQVG
jgi:hypothetical protein